MDSINEQTFPDSDKFIDFGIPMEEFHEILNAGEHPDEWNTSEPEWDAKSNEIIISYEDDVEFEEASEIIGECTQAFIEASPFFQRLPLYYQIGSGFENKPGPSTNDLPFVEENIAENIKDAIAVEIRNRRRIVKYRGEEITFRACVDVSRLPQQIRDNPIVATVESVRQIFETLLLHCSENMLPTDLIRFCIQANGLDKPISSCLEPISTFTIEKLMAIIMKVLQSKEEIMLDQGFSVDVITIRRDVGAGRRKVINVKVDRLKKRSILNIPNDKRGLCCAKSIVYALAHLEKDRRAINALRHRERPALLRRAIQLHKKAEVPIGPCTYKEIDMFEKYLDAQIVVFSTQNMNKISYKGQRRSRRINLWLHSGHFEVIKNLRGFHGSKFYCIECDKPYDHKEKHFCPHNCAICQRTTCAPGQAKRCEDCDRLCRSSECFAAHKATKGKEVLSLCDKIYQCRKCCRIINRSDCNCDEHKCGTVRCPSCQKFVPPDHLCHLRSVPAKKPSDRLIFFDFETDQETGEHVVNFAVAQYKNGDERIFKGYSACQDFCSWLFSPKHKGYTAIAHNMKGFDGQFILSWLLEQGTTPGVIPCGSKIMAITHKSLNVKVIDSFNFLPMGLAKLPECFGLTEHKKGYFPHLFNTKDNQDFIGDLPAPKFYSPDSMSASSRAKFLSWHKENAKSVFNFQEEMLAYCRSDVDILRRCCLEFRDQFIEVASVDPFQYITIASACMAVYRSKHIKKDTIAMVPVRGYINSTKFSSDSIRWLDYIAKSEKLDIKHALNGLGEKRFENISVDGYCKENNTIYQYHGCFFHGCPTCYDGDIVNPLTTVTMSLLHKKTAETTLRLRSLGFTVIEKWEHEFLKEKRGDADLISFLASHIMEDRLNPRDAFFGGRTNAVKLYYEGSAKYVDFTSLYPWVNKYCYYPVGHPEIITENFGDINNYFGIIKCKVLPPPDLHLPVLPIRCNGKLMFPLCQKCAEKKQQTPCQHSDEERCIMGTWVTEEVKLAVEKGYRITQIYEVYHFQKKSDSLFRSYIDLFLKIKQERSGWPADCLTPQEQSLYVDEYNERENVKLDRKMIKKNPGRRQVAKLALNSFWGRWGMNLNKTNISYVNSLPEFNKTFLDSTKNVKDVYFPNPEIAAIHWENTSEFIPQDLCTNIFLVAFTTAWARIKLYSEMDKLGSAVLYHDTDSIIYESTGTNDPPLGNFLGEFTDELDGDVIKTFISGGPKNYAYETVSGEICCKVRGFTLNFRNAQAINFESMKNMVCSMDFGATITVENPSKITIDAKKRKIVNKKEKKNVSFSL